jgi:RecA/RadA recombinase
MDPKKALLKKRKKFRLSPETGLSTGSTMLNLACTDTPRFGWVKGGYFFLWGDTKSGKSWLTMTCMAEALLNPSFKDYEFHFINVEGGILMDIEHYFGKKVAERLTIHDDIETIQAFYGLLHDLLRVKKKKCIIVLDSQDALDDLDAEKKFKANKSAVEKGEKQTGSYGTSKAKYHSENIKWALSAARKTDSIFIFIGQAKDKIGGFGFGERKTKAGGKSLSFYANLELQSKLGEPIKKKVRGKLREIGTHVIVKVTKNRFTGKVGTARSAVIPIYNGYGIDDVGSVVDFLITEGYFQPAKSDDKNRKRWKVPDLDLTGTRNEIIRFIEETDSHSVFQDMAGKVWKEIEDECQLVNRKRRYE